MNSWTLRQQRTQTIRQGYKQEHTAALRSVRYVRRHAMEFHGAGVADAVWDLAVFSRASRNAQNGLASALAAFRLARVSGPYGLCPDCKGPNLAPGLVHQCPVDRVSEAAHGLTVVGWKDENGCAYCPKHRPSGGIMLTTADRQQIKGLLLCLTCAVNL